MATNRNTDSETPDQVVTTEPEAPPAAAEPEAEAMVRVRASMAFGQVRRGDEFSTALTPRVQNLVNSGKLEILSEG